MFRSVMSLLVLLVASSSIAREPFTVFEGQDASAPKQPQACVSSEGLVYVTFGVGEQVYCCQIDGEKCTEPQVAFRVPNMSLGLRRGPRIAHSGTTTSRLPEDYAKKILEVPGVRDVMPIQVWTNNCRASLDIIVFNGADPAKIQKSRPLKMVTGCAWSVDYWVLCLPSRCSA